MATIDSLRRAGLIDGAPEEEFDRLLRLGAEELGTPVVLMSLIDKEGDRQFFKGALGLDEPWATRRETPLSHSFCKHVVEDGAPVIIADARSDPRFRDNLAIADLGVVAYLGVPVETPSGEPLGAVCAIENSPREWSDADLRLLRIIAAALSALVKTRLAQLEAEDARAHAGAVADSLKEANRLFLDVSRSVPGAIFRYVTYPDGSDGIEFVSEGCNDIWEYTAEELAGDPAKLWELIVDEDLPAMRESVQRAVELGERWQHRWRIVPRSGQTKWLQGYGEPFQLADGSIRWNSLILDVSVEAKAQQALEENYRLLAESQKRESTGRLAGGIAHDFNNLLAIVMGGAELLRDAQQTSDDRELLSEIIAAAQRGADLTSRLLSFARKSDLRAEIENLNDVISGMKGLMRSAVPESIALHLALGEALWNTPVDKGLFESALLNLLLNARDALRGGGSITVTSENVVIGEDYISDRQEELAPGDYVMVSVTDDGTGIPADQIDQIFDPFMTTKGKDQGTGLGLSMVQGFVKQSGGTIRVYSEAGFGSTFTLYLPAAKGSGAPLRERIHTQAAAQRSATILVVEDLPSVLRITSACLKSAGHEVIAAESGDAGLEAFLAHADEVELVLSDVVMPGDLQGPEMVAKIREYNDDIPVIFLSGYPHEASVHGDGLRRDDISLTKPVDRETLLSAVQRGLALR